MPTDTANYNTLTAESAGNFVVSKATPSVTTWPTASAITSGQALSASTLTGGNASVAGGFAFESPDTIPPVGTHAEAVIFTPTNAANYLTVTDSVNVVVKPPTRTPTKSGAWDDPATWGGTVPAPGDDVVLPAGITVTLAGPIGPFANLTIAGTLNLGANTLQVSGNLTITGTFNPGTGTVELIGGANQELTATAPGTLTFYNLKVNKIPATAKVTATSKLKATKKLTITKGKLVSASDYGDVLIETDGTLELTSDITISGNFTNNGALSGDFGITFDGGTEQNLSLLGATVFYNLTVAAGTTLIETDPNDNAVVTGTLVNHGVLRKTQPVTVTGEYIFGLAGLLVGDTSDWLSIIVSGLTGGSPLTAIQVDCIYANHPQALGTNTTDIYWTITPVGSDFVADLVLPHANLPEPQIGRYRAGAWDWGNSGFDPVTISRTDLTAFGDFAVFNNPQVATSTTTTLASSMNPSTSGQSVTFTATVSPSAASGTVTFKDGATTLGTGTLSGGVATFTTSALALGSHSLTAAYAGDASYSASTSAALTQAVALSGSIYTANGATFGKIDLATRVYSQITELPSSFVRGNLAYNPNNGLFYTATFVPKGPFRQDTKLATITKAGVVSEAFGPAGDQLYALSFGPGGTPLSTFTASDGYLGTINPVTGDFTLVAGSPDAGPSFPGLAVYLGDKLYIAGQNFDTFANGLNVFNAPATSGVAVEVAQNDLFEKMVIASDGTSLYGIDMRSTGSYQLYQINPETGAVTDLGAITGGFPTEGTRGLAYVPDNTPTTTTLASSLNPSTFGASVTFTATVSPSSASGTVTFKDGATTLGTGTLTSGTATYASAALSTGSHSLTAEYAGGASYGASTSGALSQTVNKAIPTVSTWPTASAITTVGQALSVSSLSGGSASVAGSFAWTAPATTPPAGNYSAAVTFTPTDTTNYNTVAGSVNVLVGLAAVADTVTRSAQGVTKIAVAGLLANDLDAAGRTLSISSVTAGSGGTVALSGRWITFTPEAGLPDGTPATFTYVLSNGTASTTSATVTLNAPGATYTTSPATLLQGGIVDKPGGGKILTFAAIPNFVYQVEASSNVSDPDGWTPLGSFTAGADGRLVITDPGAGDTRFYRFKK